MNPVDDGDGLAEERTTLAWSRSSLALLACGAAVLKGVPRLPDPGGRPTVGAVIVGLAIVASIAGMIEEHIRREAVRDGVGRIDERAVRRVAVANGIIGVAAFVLAVFSG